MEGGCIFLARKFRKWEWYKDANTTRVFLHCLLVANFKPGRWRGIEILRGQFISTYDSISEALDLSKQQVRTSFDKLKITREITRCRKGGALLVTVCKYEDYQSIDSYKTGHHQHAEQHADQHLNNICLTLDQHSDNTSLTCIEEGEEGKEGRRRTINGENSDAGKGQEIAEKIQSLQPPWRSRLNHIEESAITQNLHQFTDRTEDEWNQLREWLATSPEKPPQNRLRFIEEGGVSAFTRAADWDKQNNIRQHNQSAF